MADILIHHDPLDEAIQQMGNATKQIDSGLKDLLAALKRYVPELQGVAANTYRQFQDDAMRLEDSMHAALGQGQAALNAMHEEHKYSDVRAAGSFH